MSVEIDDDDIEFNREKAHNRRHKELINSLNAVATKSDNEDLRDKFDKHIQAIYKLAESIKSFPKPETPVVNVSTNNKEIVEAFRHIADQIVNEIAGLKEYLPVKNKKTTATVVRNRSGYIDYIDFETE